MRHGVRRVGLTALSLRCTMGLTQQNHPERITPRPPHHDTDRGPTPVAAAAPRQWSLHWIRLGPSPPHAAKQSRSLDPSLDHSLSLSRDSCICTSRCRVATRLCGASRELGLHQPSSTNRAPSTELHQPSSINRAPSTERVARPPWLLAKLPWLRARNQTPWPASASLPRGPCPPHRPLAPRPQE